jgi:hypothetical protein
MRSLSLDNVKSSPGACKISSNASCKFLGGVPRASALRDLRAQANSGCSWVSA